MTVTRDDRLQVRVDATVKRRLEEAATEVGLSLSAFVLQSAQRQAAEVLADRSLIRLSPTAAAAFDEALSQPARINVRLSAVLGRPTTLTWLD